MNRGLALDLERNALADGGRYAVGRDAQVRSHVQTTGLAQVQHVTFHRCNWTVKTDKK